jgi:hypothetical protein
MTSYHLIDLNHNIQLKKIYSLTINAGSICRGLSTRMYTEIVFAITRTEDYLKI